jgi:hypothetical protein
MTQSGTTGDGPIKSRLSGWIKSSLSEGSNSVEVQFLADGGVQVRNGREPGQGTLAYTAAEWRDFLAGARLGEFDGIGASPAIPESTMEGKSS